MSYYSLTLVLLKLTDANSLLWMKAIVFLVSWTKKQLVTFPHRTACYSFVAYTDKHNNALFNVPGFYNTLVHNKRSDDTLEGFTHHNSWIATAPIHVVTLQYSKGTVKQVTFDSRKPQLFQIPASDKSTVSAGPLIFLSLLMFRHCLSFNLSLHHSVSLSLHHSVSPSLCLSFILSLPSLFSLSFPPSVSPSFSLSLSLALSLSLSLPALYVPSLFLASMFMSFKCQ